MLVDHARDLLHVDLNMVLIKLVKELLEKVLEVAYRRVITRLLTIIKTLVCEVYLWWVEHLILSNTSALLFIINYNLFYYYLLKTNI